MSDQHDDRSVVESQIAYHPLCKVCSSANRHAIEVQLLLGESGPRIAKRFPEDNLNRQNLHTHRHRHMEALDSAVAEAVRAHTLEARRDAAHAVSAVTARLGQVESLLAAGLAAADAGLIRFSPSDVLALMREAAKLSLEERELEDLKSDSAAFVAAVKEIVPREQWNTIAERWDEKLGANQAPAGLEA